MAQATLARILEEIKTLQPDELRAVEQTVRAAGAGFPWGRARSGTPGFGAVGSG